MSDAGDATTALDAIDTGDVATTPDATHTADVTDATDAADAHDVAPSDAPVCGSAICSEAGMCGSVTDPCGAAVSCPPCPQPVEEPIALAGSDPVLDVSSGISVAFARDSDAGTQVQFAHRATSGWTSQSVFPQPIAQAQLVDAAVGPDGTRWVVEIAGSLLYVYRSDPGQPWVGEPTLGTATAAAIAVGTSGSTYLLVAGAVTDPSVTSGVDEGIVLLQRSGTNWMRQLVAPSMNATGPVALATTGDQPRLAWFDSDLLSVRYATPASTGFAIETVQSNLSAIALSLAIDASGAPHVVFGNTTLTRAIRGSPNNWTTTDIPVSGFVPEAIVAISGTGAETIVAATGNALVRFTQRSGAWTPDTIAASCMSSFDAAYESSGTLDVVHACTGAVTRWSLAP